MEEEGGLSKPVAMIACIAMALLYVAILYAPTLVLRLPPPPSFNNYMVRRFICAIISSILSLFVSALILPVRTRAAAYLFPVYGIRADHSWQAVTIPLFLTSLMYAGSIFLKLLLLIDSWRQYSSSSGSLSFDLCRNVLLRFLGCFPTILSNVLVWRTCIVAPLTEELVFRACMIPLLLCGGLKIYSVILLCPVFFSLAHLNHFMEIYYKQNYSIIKASQVIGLQLGYTVIFGSYASFLFIRTGWVSVAVVMGLVAFFYLLLPATSPDLYNDRIDNCSCWHGYCSWGQETGKSPL
ncbi:CAAX prenyl protease 2 isoform X2 [Prosopis cineraria]|uniref:CAAX prenyl protease 2 isoform X2 n=1 Tax=Prosopis cineraria TaxID=364024 RepID=UPI00240FB559|nr:CAAX prenyl protease 2 isoform X2 [Prosopis cineraria]